MSLKKAREAFKTLAFRLTVWYTVIFSISILIALLVFYILTSAAIQRSTDEELKADIHEFASFVAAEGTARLKTEMEREAVSEGVEKVFVRALSSGGKEIASTDMSSWGKATPSPQALRQLKNGADYAFETVTIPGQERQVRVVYSVIWPDIVLQMGESLNEKAEFLAIFRKVISPILVFGALLSALFGWFMARRSLMGVEEVTQTALQISKGSFDKRVPVKNRGDEVERLATTFNQMLDHINALINGMKEVTDNIAHDLRSPLTKIRCAAEIELSNSMTVNECKAVAANTIEECDRLLEMINTMLDITEAESGAAPLNLEEVDLIGLIGNACELFQPVAENKRITLNSELPSNCIICSDNRKLQRIISNLLDNALKYTQSGGSVTVFLKTTAQQVTVSVIDSGIGISEEDLPHIFERFYRCEQSRSQEGNGLGLSLVKAFTNSLSGKIDVTSQPDKGSAFTVTFPPLSYSS